MKIAMCISGKLRNFKHAYPRMAKYMLDPHSPDVFFYGYANDEGIDECCKSVEELWKPKDYCLKEYTSQIAQELTQGTERYNSNRRSETSIEGLLSQYTNIQQCNNLKTQYETDNGFKYDVVVRLRCDVFYCRPITDDEFGMAKDFLVLPGEWQFRSVYQYGETDAFGFSNSANMDLYSSIVEHIPEYFDQGITFHHETMMGHHINVGKKIPTKYVLPHYWFEYPEELSHIPNQRRHTY